MVRFNKLFAGNPETYRAIHDFFRAGRRRSFWWLKQLLPRTYWTVYHTERVKGSLETHFVIWKMWLGRSYDVVGIGAQALVEGQSESSAA